jgi:hypothetical protein
MSGKVIVAYCNTPTKDMYKVGSSAFFVPSANSLHHEGRGVLIDLVPYMFA